MKRRSSQYQLGRGADPRRFLRLKARPRNPRPSTATTQGSFASVTKLNSSRGNIDLQSAERIVIEIDDRRKAVGSGWEFYHCCCTTTFDFNELKAELCKGQPGREVSEDRINSSVFMRSSGGADHWGIHSTLSMMVTPFSCVEMTVGSFLPSWRPTAANRKRCHYRVFP